ncbi:family 20 glycosylhydrolase [Arenibacter sp. S6351L]|uniref:family 20 glycosylhydrolase n=1 Tax=Arenibacter sp. S6351L TaxID=2926407 RepID=UPI001FF534AA|nr:family 20 glycosylhydrolase [Arenibacter sp. S6351L]MCK0136099.1 family 20 glycosylhydrolase [Arenibacter sp. S6351L]
MIKKLSIAMILFYTTNVLCQSDFAVKGLCIAAPSKAKVNEFVGFVEKDLAPGKINTLILRIDFNFEYQSRPELRSDNPLGREDVKKIVTACKKYNINLIPQVNLLGHQSWHSTLGKLLEVYPEFDETPTIDLPEKYEWPNKDGLYCKSYCPLHPKVHEVVFDLVDEIMEVFEAKAFHAGMDEVFYLAHPDCPRCYDQDPAKLFADEVNKINEHLVKNESVLWIWGDRLIDGVDSGIGMWEGSHNDTSAAIDMISKSVVICDWHYEKAIPTPAYFALKGFQVIACPWRKSKVAEEQVAMVHSFKQNSTAEMAEKYLGVMHTVWSSADSFLDSYYNPKPDESKDSEANCLRTMIASLKNIED